ncbi:hypothetical protein D3C87_1831240 [compost metagenome]
MFGKFTRSPRLPAKPVPPGVRAATACKRGEKVSPPMLASGRLMGPVALATLPASWLRLAMVSLRSFWTVGSLVVRLRVVASSSSWRASVPMLFMVWSVEAVASLVPK